MFSKLKLLFKDTMIYGASTILARSLNYLLVPLYANKLTTGDNGIQTVIYANIALANVLFSYGLETSYLKVASDISDEENAASRLFSTAFITLFCTSTLFAFGIAFFGADLARLIGLSGEEAPFVRYSALILWLDTLLVIPFAELRLKRKALQFAIARVFGVIAVVISAFVLIIPFRMGLSGVFISQALGSLVSLLLLIPVFSIFSARFSRSQLSAMLRIGLPYVPTGIAGLLIHLIDRNLLIRIPQETVVQLYGPGFLAADIVGIYGRVAAFGVVLQLFIQVFRFAWQPFFLQHAKDPEAEGLFKNVLTISTLFTMFLALAATYFVPDLVRYHYSDRLYLLPPRYWLGLSILPWIFLSYVFDMVSTNLSAGLLITGNTRVLPIVTFSGAAVTALVCWWSVPHQGMIGAAYAITAGTVVMALVMAWYSLRYFPVPYEWKKLSILLTAGILLALASAEAEQLGIRHPLMLMTKTGLLVGYGSIAMLLFRQEWDLVSSRLRSRLLPQRQK